MEKKLKTPREKRRNMEKRKEKSRDAARCRRSLETQIFEDLSKMLPLWKSDSVSHLDKASIIRIAISYLKIRAIIQSIPVAINDRVIDENEISNADSLFLNALDGFLLVMNTDGDIVFISENVNRYLGLSQVDLLGQSMYEITHPCDHAEITEMLSNKVTNAQKSYFLRMKCTITNKGRNVNIKSASYKVIQYSGRVVESKAPTFNIMKRELSDGDDDSGDSVEVEDFQLPEGKAASVSSFNFVAVGEPISHPANIEIPLGQNTFLTKHSLDMKFTYADEKIMDFFGYNPSKLLDKSVFDYHHAEDSIALRNCFKNLFQKGQSQTEKYRFLAAGGGFAWVLTQATVIHNSSQKPQSVVCVNFVITEVENANEVYSLCQLENDCKISSATSDCIQSKSETEYKMNKSPREPMEKLNIDRNSTIPFYIAEKIAVISHNGIVHQLDTPAMSPISYQVELPNSMQDTIDLPLVESPQKSPSNTIQPLSANDLFVECSLPSSPETLPDSFAVNETWILTNDTENAARVTELIGNTVTEPFTDEFLQTVTETAYPEKPKFGNCSSSQNTIPERVFSTEKIFSSLPVEMPKPATTDVFVPFTEDMDKNFVGFTKDETLKVDAPDLTHLAPTPGDVCVPLDEPSLDIVLPTEMDLDDIGLSIYGLLPNDKADDKCNLLSSNECNLLPKDDCNFMSNDDSNDYLSATSNIFLDYKENFELSPVPLSPVLPQKEKFSIPSLNSNDSPSIVDPRDEFYEFERLNTMDDLTENTLLPLLLDHDAILSSDSNDFIWNLSSRESDWSSMSSSLSSSYSSIANFNHDSRLAKLLTDKTVCSQDSGKTIVGGDETSINGKRAVIDGAKKKIIYQSPKSPNENRSSCRSYSKAGFKVRTTTTQQRSNSTNNIKDGSKSLRTSNSLSRDSMTKNSSAALVVPSVINLLNDEQMKKVTCSTGIINPKHENFDVKVGNKRGNSESWNRTNVSCKRSKTGDKMKAMNEGIQELKTSVRRIPAVEPISSVLKELLIDAHYNYSEHGKETKQRNQTTDEDMRIIEEVMKTGDFRNMSLETWARISRKILDMLSLSDTEVDLPTVLTNHDCKVNVPNIGATLQGSGLRKAFRASNF